MLRLSDLPDAITNGALMGGGETRFTSVSTGTRTLPPGALLFALPLIGVTGSNGETTTVTQVIASILAAAHGEAGRLATHCNLNNDIGRH